MIYVNNEKKVIKKKKYNIDFSFLVEILKDCY